MAQGAVDRDIGGRRYGGEHHPYSLVDRIGEAVEHGLAEQPFQRDPQYIARALPVLDLLLTYFDAQVEGLEHVPADGPSVITGQHSGGLFMPDHWAFVRQWVRERGPGAPLYSLAFDLVFSMPVVGPMARRFGAVPACPEHAGRLLDEGVPVLVYPGGDVDDYRPWSERHRVDLHGHMGFVRLALRHGVPVVPMVAHGSHDAVVVVTRGEGLARRLGLDRLRINVLPVVVGPPFGVTMVPSMVWPLPAKVWVRVGEPLDWSHLDPTAADDPDVVRRCYDQVQQAMQAELDAMVAALPHPVLARLSTAAGLDRARSALRRLSRAA